MCAENLTRAKMRATCKIVRVAVRERLQIEFPGALTAPAVFTILSPSPMCPWHSSCFYFYERPFLSAPTPRLCLRWTCVHARDSCVYCMILPGKTVPDGVRMTRHLTAIISFGARWEQEFSSSWG